VLFLSSLDSSDFDLLFLKVVLAAGSCGISVLGCKS
jgi:hypothetical protein